MTGEVNGSVGGGKNYLRTIFQRWKLALKIVFFNQELRIIFIRKEYLIPYSYSNNVIWYQWETQLTQTPRDPTQKLVAVRWGSYP